MQNPIRALSQVLASIFNPDGSVAVERFYDGVRAITPVDKADIKALGYDERRELGLVNAEPYGELVNVKKVLIRWLLRLACSVHIMPCLAFSGEAGFSTLERIWLRPTLEICGIAGGFAGTGIKTIIPSKAIAKIACRLVPDQDPAQVLALVKRSFAGKQHDDRIGDLCLASQVLRAVRSHIELHLPPAVNVSFHELGYVSSAPVIALLIG